MTRVAQREPSRATTPKTRAAASLEPTPPGSRDEARTRARPKLAGTTGRRDIFLIPARRFYLVCVLSLRRGRFYGYAYASSSPSTRASRFTLAACAVASKTTKPIGGSASGGGSAMAATPAAMSRASRSSALTGSWKPCVCRWSPRRGASRRFATSSFRSHARFACRSVQPARSSRACLTWRTRTRRARTWA